VANGPGSANGSRNASGGLGVIRDALENKLTLLLTAVFLGVGGNLAIVGNAPDARADPWTGTQGRATLARVEQLEHSQALDDQHRLDAAGGYARIRTLERQCIRNESRIEAIQEQLRKINGYRE
jgi:hypothetical protein